MRLFTKAFSLALVAITVPLLFLPKINLLSVGGQTAGIRVDDLVLFFVCTLIGWAHFILQKRINANEKWLIILVSFSLFSFAMNRLLVNEGWLHVNANILYCFRIAEYFVFFYIGAMCSLFFKTGTIIRAFFLWNMFLMILQRIGLIGQFTFAGYEASITSRVVGIGSFPSETGMFIVLAYCFLAFSEDKSKYLGRLVPPDIRNFFSQTYEYWLFLTCSVLVIVTGSRVAIVALLFVFLFRIKDTLKKRSFARWFYAAVFITVGLYMSAELILKSEALIKRSFGLLSFSNLDLVGMVWDRINVAYDPVGNEAVKYGAYDMSWWLRIHKWMYALKIFVQHPECWLQGIGPGFASAALDGGLLRILVEYGLIGCLIFWKFFSTIARQSVQLYWMVVAIMINMIFFDVYLAYKPMSLLFFVAGSTWAMEKQFCNVGTQATNAAAELR